MIVELSIGLIAIGAASYAVWELRRKMGTAKPAPVDEIAEFRRAPVAKFEGGVSQDSPVITSFALSTPSLVAAHRR